MARPKTRYTQRMLDSASCRHRYELEFVKNLRRRESEKWFPPKLKDLVSELLFARDYAIARGFKGGEVNNLVNRMERKWWETVRANRYAKQEHIEDAREFIETARRIVDHYSDSQKIDIIAKYVKRKKSPIVRMIIEHRLPTFEKKKIGGPSKYTFASSIDRVFREGDEYKLLVHHLTSSVDPAEVRYELARRIDIYGTVWNAEKFLKKKISTIVFDVVRTKPPAIPTLINCKKCKGSGSIKQDDGYHIECPKCAGMGIAYVSTRRCDTTAEIWIGQYQQYAYKGEASTAKYKEQAEELIGHLAGRGNTFSYRVEMAVSRETIDMWLADTYEQIRELAAAARRGTYPRNTSQCGSTHAACPYRTQCAGLNDKNSEVFFRLVEEAYPGLKTW